jgi:predicted DsbA family dithiol-disulfide isomerase
VWTDVVCPWCRAGIDRFDDAVQRLDWDEEVELVFRPFQLPQRPPRGHPSTFDAHRLLEWALDVGGTRAQGALERRLLRACTKEGVDPSDHAALARVAGEAGLDAAAATSMLASDAYDGDVRAGLARADELDIHGVPTFVFAGTLAIPGAQDPETFMSLLTRVRERMTNR